MKNELINGIEKISTIMKVTSCSRVHDVGVSYIFISRKRSLLSHRMESENGLKSRELKGNHPSCAQMTCVVSF